jgi:hypothetical protein
MISRALILLLSGLHFSFATTFYVSTNGLDTSPGTFALPWRTVQKAANAMQAGDTVLVLSGNYDERITSARGGTNELSRIRFLAQGAVLIKGFLAQHPFISIQGFDITGWNSASILDARVQASANGDYFQLLNCNLRDGVQLIASNMTFVASNLIVCPSGGFFSAGFKAGQTIQLSQATNVTLLSPTSTSSGYTISSLTDTSITVLQSNIVSEGPKPAYISGSPNYALYLASGSERCVIRSNTFRNLSYRYCFIDGTNHLFEANVLEQNNGWDLLFYMGADHRFIGNLFQNHGWGTYQPSPDVFDNWPTKYERIVFSNNFVQNMVGVINAQKRNSTVSGPLSITHNVFVDVGWFSVRFPNTSFEHNTLLRVAKQGSPSVQVEKHPLIFDTSDYATNAVIRHNVFVDCGQATGATTPDQVGWYRFIGSTNTVVTVGNFVSGGAPGFAPKTGFPESDPLLNGGSPGFLNISDPLGPDGIPFTADDGLQLRSDSKLRGKGDAGTHLGAYQTEPRPVISITRSNALITLAWLESFADFAPQYALRPTGTWWNLSSTIVTQGGFVSSTFLPTNSGSFFRLVK